MDVVEAGAGVVELDATDTDVAVALETFFAEAEVEEVGEVVTLEAECGESFPLE